VGKSLARAPTYEVDPLHVNKHVYFNPDVSKRTKSLQKSSSHNARPHTTTACMRTTATFLPVDDYTAALRVGFEAELQTSRPVGSRCNTHTHTRPHTANHTKNALASSISSEQTSVIIEETQRQSQRTCSHTFAVVVNDANQLISGYPSCRARSMTHCVLEMTQSRQYTLSLTKTWNMARHTAQIPTVSRSTFEQEI
jgi:hypothetical protein